MGQSCVLCAIDLQFEQPRGVRLPWLLPLAAGPAGLRGPDFVAFRLSRAFASSS